MHGVHVDRVRLPAARLNKMRDENETCVSFVQSRKPEPCRKAGEAGSRVPEETGDRLPAARLKLFENVYDLV